MFVGNSIPAYSNSRGTKSSPPVWRKTISKMLACGLWRPVFLTKQSTTIIRFVVLCSNVHTNHGATIYPNEPDCLSDKSKLYIHGIHIKANRMRVMASLHFTAGQNRSYRKCSIFGMYLEIANTAFKCRCMTDCCLVLLTLGLVDQWRF